MTLHRPLERSDGGPSPGADLPMAGPPRAAERKGRHGSGAFAAAGADGPLRVASTGVASRQSDEGIVESKPTDNSGDLVVRFLATDPAFEGIGVARASKLRQAFGNDLARVLGGGDVELLAGVLGRERAETLAAAWQEHLAKADVVVWLSEQGFDPYLGTKAIRIWGAGAPEILRGNPYVMLAIASWDRVDTAARALGFGPDHACRSGAGAEAAAYRRLDRSHTWTAAADLEGAAARTLGVGIKAARAAVSLAVGEGALVRVGEGYQPVGAHVMEKFVADRVAGMLRPGAGQEDLLVGRRAVTKSLAMAGKLDPHAGIDLTPEQQGAVGMALTSPISLLLGGAGVGKTSTLAAVHRAAERCGIAVLQMALSGRAAMRMREATGREARTIAGFLRACERGTLHPGADCLVVVDEASMLDLPLFYSILRRIGPESRVLLVGDPYQLPPIKFGLTFHLLAEIDGIPKVELTRVHRQAAETGIPRVAHAIRNGQAPEVPDYRVGMRRGVSFLECEEAEAIHAITDVLSDLGDAGGETRVLTPVRRGAAGLEEINGHLHRIMSAGQEHCTERSLAVGDPVMFTRNDYARDLQNGSLGRVLGFPVPGVGEVDFDGRRVSLAGADLVNLALAYCLTVHKAQGSQFRRIVMPVFAARILDRTLVYTAVTRATEQVVLVGNKEAFVHAVTATPASRQRETGLARMLINLV